MRVMRGPAESFSDPAPGQTDEPGATIGHIGRYALKHKLGEGGIGTVFAAHDPLLSRLIAVKTLHVEVESNERESFNALFLNEARAAAGLSHPHIVTVFDAGISDDRAYIAMELLKGRDLRQLREEGWRATPAQAALIARRVADALGYAHNKGVVHRDVKPANIFMVGRTQPRVLDFGIARVAHRHDGHTVAGEAAVGSPYYMAPEQVRREQVDRRADVFSLGVVLYELLTDVKPFRGSTLEEIMAAVLEHEPALANVVDPSVPEELAAITAKALAKNPDHRYRSARAFARELRRWLDENTVASDGDVQVEQARGKKSTWIAAMALGALAIAGLVWITSTPRRQTASTGTAPIGQVSSGTVSVSAPSPVATSEAALPAASASATGVPATTLNTAVAAVPVATAPVSAATIATQSAPIAAMTVAAPMSSAQGASAAKTTQGAAKVSRESAKDRRAREARERDLAKQTATAATPAVAVPNGIVRVAVSPWGDLEVDGKPMGTSPPLNELSLSPGKHQIVIRNSDLPPFSTVVNVTSDQPVNLKYKF